MFTIIKVQLAPLDHSLTTPDRQALFFTQALSIKLSTQNKKNKKLRYNNHSLIFVCLGKPKNQEVVQIWRILQVPTEDFKASSFVLIF